MRHNDPSQLVKELLTDIANSEQALINNKSGTDTYLFIQMMSNTREMLKITKPIYKPNTNTVQLWK